MSVIERHQFGAATLGTSSLAMTASHLRMLSLWSVMMIALPGIYRQGIGSSDQRALRINHLDSRSMRGG